MSYDDDYAYRVQAIAAAEAAEHSALMQQQQLEQLQMLQAAQEHTAAQLAADMAAHALDVTQIRRNLEIDDVRQVLQDSWNRDAYVPPPEPHVSTYDKDPSLTYHLDQDRQRHLDEATAHEIYYQQMAAGAEHRVQEVSQAAFDLARIEMERSAHDNATRFIVDQTDHTGQAAQQFVDDFVRSQTEAAEAAKHSAMADAAAQLEQARLQAELAYADELNRSQTFVNDACQRAYADQLALDIAQAEAQRSQFDLDYRHQAEARVADYTAQLTLDAERAARERAEADQAELTARLLQEAEAHARHEAAHRYENHHVAGDEAVRAHLERAVPYFEEALHVAYDDCLRTQLDHTREAADRALAEQWYQAEAQALEQHRLAGEFSEHQRQDAGAARQEQLHQAEAQTLEQHRLAGELSEHQRQDAGAARQEQLHQAEAQALEQHRLAGELYEHQRQDAGAARQEQLHQAEAQTLEQHRLAGELYEHQRQDAGAARQEQLHQAEAQTLEQHRLAGELYEHQRQDAEAARQEQLHQAEAQTLEQHRLAGEFYEHQRQDAEAARQEQLHQAEAQTLEQHRLAGEFYEHQRQDAEAARQEQLHQAEAQMREHAEAETSRRWEAELSRQLLAEAEAHAREQGAQLYAQHLNDEMRNVFERAEEFRQGQLAAALCAVEDELECLRQTIDAHAAETAKIARAQAMLDAGTRALAAADQIREEARAAFEAAEFRADKQCRDRVELASVAAADAADLVRERTLESARLLAAQLLHPDFDAVREVVQTEVEQAWAEFLSTIEDRIAGIAARLRGETEPEPELALLSKGDPMDEVRRVAAKLARAKEPVEFANAGRLAFAKDGTDRAKKREEETSLRSSTYLSPWDGRTYPVLSSRTKRRAANSGDRASITESEEYNRQLASGCIGLQRPGRVNAGGPDSIVFDPVAGCIVVNDSKYRGPEGDFGPPKTLQEVLRAWGGAIETAVMKCKTGDAALDGAVKAAWHAGTVRFRRQDRRGPGLPEDGPSDRGAF